MAPPGQHLYLVHRVMISMAIAFCAGFAIRETVVAARGGGTLPAILAVFSGVGAIALAAYFRWWLRAKGAAMSSRDKSPHRP